MSRKPATNKGLMQNNAQAHLLFFLFVFSNLMLWGIENKGKSC